MCKLRYVRITLIKNESQELRYVRITRIKNELHELRKDCP